MGESKRKQYIRVLNCAANHADDEMITVSVDEVREIIDLLTEQEPRVMTFEEVYKFSFKAFDSYEEDSPLYVECRERYPYQLKWLTAERAHEWMRDDETMERRKLTYNNAKERWGWRCWTSRPTPEQMANTPWEKDEE